MCTCRPTITWITFQKTPTTRVRLHGTRREVPRKPDLLNLLTHNVAFVVVWPKLWLWCYIKWEVFCTMARATSSLKGRIYFGNCTTEDCSSLWRGETWHIKMIATGYMVQYWKWFLFHDLYFLFLFFFWWLAYSRNYLTVSRWYRSHLFELLRIYNANEIQRQIQYALVLQDLVQYTFSSNGPNKENTLVPEAFLTS